MIRRAALPVVAAFALVTVMFVASDAHKDDKKQKAEVVTLTGEIVDTGCYLDHGARGAGHRGCAAKCISNGMPMGLLTSDNALYLLTMNHDDADPFNNAKKMAASIVEITGKVSERGGLKAIEVTKIKEIKAAK